MNRKCLGITLLGLGIVSTGVGIWYGSRAAGDKSPAPAAVHTSASEQVAGETQTAPAGSLAIEPQKPRSDQAASARDRLKKEIEATKSDRVRELAQNLLAAMDRHQEITAVYDDTHRFYQERFVAHAPESELASYREQLDKLTEEMKASSQNIYQLTGTLNDVYVADRLATLDRSALRGH